MKIISWNINGIRAVFKKGFLNFLKSENPDIICLQEIKANKDQLSDEIKLINSLRYNNYWYSAEKKGYSGTAILTKEKPLKILKGINQKEFDNEGRVLTIELKKYFLISIYTPNSKNDLSRLKYRQEWDQYFLKYIKKLEKNKPVIFCGDLNVAYKPIDLARPKENKGKHGYTKEEREGFSNFLKSNFIDTYRYFYPKKKDSYTWWTYWRQARKRNVGWRIDYCLVSKKLIPNLKNAFIKQEIMGSDHCPIGINID